MKRIFDFVLSALALVVLSPFLLIVALFILLDSGFPVFFVQERVGLKGNSFSLYKFRTMSLLAGSEKGSFDAGNSSRVTRIGKWLRRTKIDEWPQFFNVLKGDMSIVGPRPEVKKWTSVYPQRWEIVHKVRPGITDNASLLFRNEEEILSASASPENTYRDEILPLKLDLDVKYVNHHSFFTDLSIILRTAWAVIGR